jgi:hypothetical protein
LNALIVAAGRSKRVCRSNWLTFVQLRDLALVRRPIQPWS